MFTEIEKNLNLVEEHKEQILSSWMAYEIVVEKLTINTMQVDFFKEKFASKVFDFAISVVKKENLTGDCPVIGVMLMLFKKKNIPLHDIFIICVHLKNALLHFALKKNILTEAMLDELSYLMDYNFEGVIKEYVLLYYKDSLIRKKPQDEKLATTIDSVEITEKLDVLTATSAELYLQEVTVDMEMIEELDELEHDTLDAIGAEEYLDQNSLDESAKLFGQYANVLNGMLEFEELSYTLTILCDMLREVAFDSFSDETKFMIDIYLKAIISDLQSWRMAIFITMEAEDIHYLDKTLMSSIAQIQMTLMPQEEAQEDEIEFF